jgi:hypothetical protein
MITIFDDDGIVAVLMIAVADDVTVAVPITISLTLSNRYANGTDPAPTSLPRALRCKFQPRRRSLRHIQSLRAPIVVKLWEANTPTPGSFCVGKWRGDREVPRLSPKRSGELINEAAREDTLSERDRYCSLFFPERSLTKRMSNLAHSFFSGSGTLWRLVLLQYRDAYFPSRQPPA